MGAYIIRRLIWVGALLFFISLITFVIFSVLPAGDPAALRAGRQPSPALLDSIRETLGLDRSKPHQFYRFMLDVLPFVAYNEGGFLDLKFDASPYLGIYLGRSFQNEVDVLPEIFDRLPATIFLTSGAVIVWLCLGIPIGMLSAIRSRTLGDRFVMILALIAISCPVYFLGLVSIYLFDENIGRWQVMPGNGAYQEADGIFDKGAALFMPWLVLSASFAAIYARFLRGNLIEVMSEDYIRTARAKGLTERRIVLKHGVRSALTPIVTLLGLDIGILLGGAILTETVFNIQGIGRYAYEAIVRSDLPVIQGTVLFGAFFIVMMSLLVDIVYAFLDPRVRYS